MADVGLLLAGAVIQRVDLAEQAMLLRARSPGRTVVVILAATPRSRGVGIAPGKGPRLGPPGAPGALLAMRRRLEGARVEWLDDRRVVLDRSGDRLVVEIAAEVVVRAGGPDEAEAAAGAARADDEDAWLEKGEALASALATSSLEAQRSALAAALKRAIARLDRRVLAVSGDLGRIDEAAAAAAQAALFVADAARAPRGATRLTVTDWSSGEAREVSMELDPARPAREQIDAVFKRARRLKQGGVIGERRIAEARAAAEALRAIAPSVAEAESAAALEALAGAARRAAPRDFRATVERAPGAARRAAGQAPSLPYRTFQGSTGANLLVGKGAAHNDELTFKVARPHDHWLHAKGWKGAHVIVPLDKNTDCPADRLIEAAHLAAHFSDARGEAVVEIEHTPRRYLRKPKGAAPGLVVVDREKVLALRTDPELLERLLASEVNPR